MDKMKMAHDYVINHLKDTDLCYQAKVNQGWLYADTMQAELDKRNKAEAAQKRKEMREILNAQNTFVEREGQHFDDVEEWQPDWSQAPEWAKWWAMDADIDCYWFNSKPELMSLTWMPFNASEVKKAPSFDYKGDWRESLRERP